MSLQETSKNIVTISFLSKFERNQSDISLQNFTLLLNRIGIDIIEFMHVYHLNEEIDRPLFSEVQLNYVSENIEWFKERLKNLKIKNDFLPSYEKKLHILLVEILLHNLGAIVISNSSRTEIKQYLLKIENWSYFDLYLFGHSMSLYSYSTLTKLVNLSIKKSVLYHDKIEKDFSILFLIMNNSILYCLENNDIVLAKKYYTKLCSYKIDSKDYYHKVKLKGLKALILYKLNQIDQGLFLLKETLNVMTLVEDTEDLIIHEQNYLKNILSPEEFMYVFSDQNKIVHSLQVQTSIPKLTKE